MGYHMMIVNGTFGRNNVRYYPSKLWKDWGKTRKPQSGYPRSRFEAITFQTWILVIIKPKIAVVILKPAF